ncbi:MAG: hypothetical protein KIT24_06285 [Phycisphaeraceae bacterium]|nr:hypothetical protein [Phycisphaeraceae bacterium]
MTPPAGATRRRVLVLSPWLRGRRIVRLLVLGHPGPVLEEVEWMLSHHPEVFGPGSRTSRYAAAEDIRQMPTRVASERHRRVLVERVVFDVLHENRQLPDGRALRGAGAKWLFVVDDPHRIAGTGLRVSVRQLAERLDRMADHAIELSGEPSIGMLDGRTLVEHPEETSRALAEWLGLASCPVAQRLDTRWLEKQAELAEIHTYATEVIGRHAIRIAG